MKAEVLTRLQAPRTTPTPPPGAPLASPLLLPTRSPSRTPAGVTDSSTLRSWWPLNPLARSHLRAPLHLRVILPPRGHLATFGDMFNHNWEMLQAWVEARDAAEHRTMHRRLPTMENYPAKAVTGSKGGKPCKLAAVSGLDRIVFPAGDTYLTHSPPPPVLSKSPLPPDVPAFPSPSCYSSVSSF